MYAHIGSILVSFGIFELFIWAGRKDIENYGYVWIRRKKNIYRKIILKIEKFFITILAVCTPIFNLILALTILFKYDEVMKLAIQSLIREGKIEKVNKIYIRHCKNVGSEEK